MMERQLLILERVAEVLAGVPQTIVFTGGATISLYLDAVSAPDIRPTIEIAPVFLSSVARNSGRRAIFKRANFPTSSIVVGASQWQKW